MCGEIERKRENEFARERERKNEFASLEQDVKCVAK
jgi:hypothetical protein